MKNTKQYCAPVALVISVGEMDIIRTSGPELEFPIIDIPLEDEE